MIACIRLPYFAVGIEARAFSSLRGQAVVLVDAGQRVGSVSEAAARSGIQVGWSLPQAYTCCPDVIVHPAAPSRYQDALDDLLEGLSRFSAHIEAEDSLALRADGRRGRPMQQLHASQVDDAPAATCYLDLGRLPPDEASQMAVQLQRCVDEHTGMSAQIGLSSGRFPARVAASAVRVREQLIVPDGQEAVFLAPFTVGLLPLDGETLRQLDLLGLHTLGQLAALPLTALVERFGKLGRAMRRLASGHDTSPVAHYMPPNVERVTQQFQDALDNWAQLDAALTDITTSTMQRLAVAGQVVRQICLRLALDDGTHAERQVTLRQARGEAQPVTAVVLELAHTLHLSSGVTGAELVLRDIAPAQLLQLSLFERDAVPQAHLTAVLADLVARYGEQFYWACTVDESARLPERRYRWEKATGT